MIVGVSQRGDHWVDRDETRDAVDRRLILWLASAGFVPVPIPNSLPPSRLQTWLSTIQPGAILLSGGNDLGEDPARDATEAILLSYAQDHHLPVLALCRGMLMMADWLGGEISRIAGHVRTRHQLHATQGANWPQTVNSFHNWTVASCPTSVEVIARALDDNAIEAIRHRYLPWQGWMWHPEREYPAFDPIDLQRLQVLFGGEQST